MTRLFALICASTTFAMVFAFNKPAFADGDNRIYINVGSATTQKSNLALPPLTFLGTPSLAPHYKAEGAELYNTIENDVEISNLFKVIPHAAYLEDPAKVGLTPAPGNPAGFHFSLWSQAGAEFLIRGGFQIIDKKKIQFEVYVYYVPDAKLVLGKKYEANLKDARRLGHTFADDLMLALTGKKGIFRTKFVVTSDRGGHKWKEVYVMDWDGRNIVQVSNHHSIAISPAWSPNGKTIAYSDYAYHPHWKGRNVDLFTYDLFTGKRYLVSSRIGMNSGAVFTPDGNNLLVTLSEGASPDIYKMTADGDNPQQLTHGPGGALNVEPNVSADGKHVVFSSDRAGHPMIFTMDIDGSNVKQLTFNGIYNSSPCFSPDGKTIVYAGQQKDSNHHGADHFDIFTIDTEGNNQRRLTYEKKGNGRYADNEDPSFSPDGRFIVFTSDRTGRNQIWIMNTDGSNQHQITMDKHNYFKARWSPYLD